MTQNPNVRGYEFREPFKKIWVLWSPEENDVSFQLPENYLAVLDKYGNSITPEEDNTVIVNSPIYIEIAP